MTSHEVHGGSVGTTAGFSASFFAFPLLIIIPPLLHTYLLLPPKMGNSTDQAAHYHILSLKVWGFTSESALGCLYTNEVCYK
jgi:hypothetical protein